MVARDLESQEPADGPIVGDFPVVLNVGLESGDVLSLFRGYRHVISCDRDDHVFIRRALEENRVVDSGMSESKILYEDPAHFLVPPTTCLLQPIKAFHKAAHFSFFPWLKYSSGWLHVDRLLECCIEIHTLDINMFNLPSWVAAFASMTCTVGIFAADENVSE